MFFLKYTLLHFGEFIQLLVRIKCQRLSSVSIYENLAELDGLWCLPPLILVLPDFLLANLQFSFTGDDY